MEDKENKNLSIKEKIVSALEDKKSGTASSSFTLFSGAESRAFNFVKTTLATQSTSAQPEPQKKCLCGSVPSKGDTFYYQSKYSKNLVEGIVDYVKDGYIQSKNHTLYSFDEIFIKTKLEIREEKINEILRKND